MKYKIKKVKKFEDGFQINYDKVHPKIESIVLAELQMKTTRINSSNLKEAMFQLKNDFNSLLEMPSEMINDNPFFVNEINFKYHEENGLGVQFIGERRLTKTLGDLVIKTPFVWERSVNIQERINPNLLALVNEVILEAQEFVEHEQNNQLEIFAEAV